MMMRFWHVSKQNPFPNSSKNSCKCTIKASLMSLSVRTVFGLETEKLERIGITYLKNRRVSFHLAIRKHNRFHFILRQNDTNMKIGNNLEVQLSHAPCPANTFRFIEIMTALSPSFQAIVDFAAAAIFDNPSGNVSRTV